MKFGVVIKSTTVNRFVLHTLQRNITHLAVITRKTNIKLGILKRGNWKRAGVFSLFEKVIQRNGGKKSDFCVSSTTLCRQKIKICMQKLFLGKCLLEYKFRFAVVKKKTKKTWGNFSFEIV